MCEEQQRLLYLPLKGQIPGALKGKPAGVALGQETVFLAAEGQFHPVTAFHLKGDVVMGTVMHTAVGVMMVMMAAWRCPHFPARQGGRRLPVRRTNR